MAGLVKNRSISYNRIPGPEGMTGEQASSVYRSGPGEYPEMPMPATHFVTATTALASLDVTPSVNVLTNAGIVDRSDKMTGYYPTGGKQAYSTTIPAMYDSPYSSKFQPWLIGPIVNYIKNAFLYRAGYPAASVMLGGMHNLALSTRVDQLVTRSSGGPGPAAMTTSQRRFGKVQNVPRYSTAPQAYPTMAAPG
jgi:hypothetical protein